MSATETELYRDAFEKLLASACDAKTVRAIEAGGSPIALWDALEGSGFLALLVPEAHGGAGLSLRQAMPLLAAAGAAAVPVSVGPTMVARAVLAAADIEAPPGAIALARGAAGPWGEVSCASVPWGMTADWVLVELAGRTVLLDTQRSLRACTGTTGSLGADLRWEIVPEKPTEVPGCPDLHSAIAVILAAHLAGAMEAILVATTRYANERQQVGKPIGKFQAIQQQLSVLAEQTAATRMAAEIGCASCGSATYLPDPVAAMIAKARSSAAVSEAASIAHAVHGAIGVTQEYDLQLLTRRLHAWRLEAGGEDYWHQRLGASLLAQQAPMLDFIRSIGASAGR